MKTKEAFHELIDNIKDEERLKSYFELIRKLNNNPPGVLWNSLTTKEQDELLQSYEESLDVKNHIQHEELKKQHEKWLKK